MKFSIHKSLLSTVILSVSLTGVTDSYARTILTPQCEMQYEQRKTGSPAIASKIALPSGITREEEEALKFLYAYMATPDVLDYDTGFYLENVRLSLQAAEEMPWGKSVPDREWRHFVLPVRVNNENLDHSRSVFYEELKERVKDMSMEDAILEVNHWCHEKVSYQPSDARTSSPLATVCNALGRCGEESTFTVTALRSVGIPARQVYTPRWAHTDDNHAWVEAWANGKWHFLGACEPEAVLDLAWFNAPASRGMLMNTNVAGFYDGPEEKIELTPTTTVINVTENYAPVARSGIFVTDSSGNPVENATVRFSLYNYAEFYPLAVKHTDKNGYAEFTSGLGDMVVWATDGSLFNLSPLHAADTLHLTLDKDASFTGTLEFDLVPPVPGGNLPEVSAETTLLNDRRKAYEDSVRLNYVGTFVSPERAHKICAELGLDDKAADLLVKSRGNHGVIEKFLRETHADRRKRAVDLLGAIAEKDLHDVTSEVLADHLTMTRGDEASPLFVPYVLNPRIESEMLRPYKEKILQSLTPEQIVSYTESPYLIVEDLNRQVLPDLYNPGRFRQSATATLDDRIADTLNRAIAFVAVCRSLGVPARIDPVSHTTQFADTSGDWHDVSFATDTEDIESQNSGKGVLNIENKSTDLARQPKYYSQFSISRIKDGVPELMEFDDFESVESINNRRQPLIPGQYMMVTGQRLADGAVLARADFFTAHPEETVSPALIVRQDTTALQVIGSIDAELLYTPIEWADGNANPQPARSILSTTGRGYYVLGLIAPGHEPSAHALNDIATAADELAATGRTILLLFPDSEAVSRFRSEDYGNLPANVVFGIDDRGIAEALREGLELPTISAADIPVFVVADTFNRIVFANRGYTIHLGEKLARTLHSVE